MRAGRLFELAQKLYKSRELQSAFTLSFVKREISELLSQRKCDLIKEGYQQRIVFLSREMLETSEKVEGQVSKEENLKMIFHS